jgi:hypothetical protein
MNASNRLTMTFDMLNVSRWEDGTVRKTVGGRHTMTGAELACAITKARAHVASINEAIAAMSAVLDTATPINEPAALAIDLLAD